MTSTNLRELKAKSPAELLSLAEKNGVEGASAMRKQDMLFAILKIMGEQPNQNICGEGVLEVLPDGFGFLQPISHRDAT